MFFVLESLTVATMTKPRATAAGLTVALLLSGLASVGRASANDGSSASTTPTPVTTARYDIKSPPEGCIPPHSDVLATGTEPTSVCGGQRVRLPTDNGDVYVETWIPARRPGGPAVRTRTPSILIMTPYVTFDGGARIYDYVHRFVDYFVPRGYAVALGHVPGSTSSDGCLGIGGAEEVDASVIVVDFLGRRAPWSGGKASVGMLGLSYDGATAIGAASLGDRARIGPLKAIVAVAGVTSGYENLAWNGVPTGTAVVSATTYAAISALPGDGLERRSFDCGIDNAAAAAAIDTDGRYRPHWDEREYRRGAPDVEAATLVFQGLKDTTVYPSMTVGWFDRLPPGTPRKVVVGQWPHGWPDQDAAATTMESWGNDLPNPIDEQTDAEAPEPNWLAMTHAWFDRYLLGLDSDVDAWPTAQIGSNIGTWRGAPDWPATGDVAAHLPLRAASGGGMSTTFAEAGPAVVFELDAGDGIHLTGQPVLDLWVRVDGPAPESARLGVTVEALAADGTVIDAVATYGARAVAYRAPFVDGYFRQETADEVDPMSVVRVAVPLMPTDVVVPSGGSLRISIAGTTSGAAPASVPSGSASNVTIHHDCTYRSALRFLDAAAPQETTAPGVEEPLAASAAQPRLNAGGCDGPALDPQGVLAGEL